MDFKQRLFFQIQYWFNPPWDTGITPPEVEAFAASHPPGRALDLGCGTGTNAIYLAKCGWKVTGVDFIGNAIRTAKRKARKAGVSVNFLKDDVSRLKNVTGRFDLILDIGCLHSLSSERQIAYIQNISRLLDPQGFFLLYTFVKDESGSGAGLGRVELSRLEERLDLIERQDGTDRGRNSAWFTWQKPIDLSPVQ